MANYCFNNAKGRAVEYYYRVKNNDPSTSGFILVPCSASDTEANAQDANDLTAALATAINEQAAGNWARKTLTDSDLAALEDPDSDNDYDLAFPAVTWGPPGPTAGNNTTGLLVCYAPDVAGADGTIIPLSHHDFAVTADGNNVVLNAGTWLTAS